ncbi:MAG TPA: MlaD family protein [Candidatus Acidoferrales bacterium]|nr:MlaD family protein [Candidatus Acidoferrales bacterium]
MAQRKQLTWTELRVGLFVLAGLALLAVAIFYVTGVNWGAKYSLKTYLPEVSDLQKGAPVSLDGVTVGSVENLKINPHPADRMHNIEVDMRVDKRYQNLIRTDSQASLVTSGLLGNRYVTVSRGLQGSVVQNQGTIPGSAGNDMQQIVERGIELEANLGQLTQQVGDIIGAVRRGEGTAGKFIYDPGLYNRLNSSAAKIDSLVASVQSGKGSIGKLVVSDELYNKVDATMGHAETIFGDIQAQKGTLGKLVYDPVVYDQTKQFLANSNALLAGVREGKGTLGKLVTDDTVFTNLRDASANVRDVTGKLNNGQGTMGKFFTDPQLYNNMTGLTGDMRLMIGDFRRDPKKFLHIKLSVF